MIKDPQQELLFRRVIPSDDYDGTDELQSIDLRDYASGVTILINHSATASGTVTIQIQESDEAAANFANIDGKVLVIENERGDAHIDIDPRATKRFIRARVVAASSGYASIAATAIGTPRYQNTPQSAEDQPEPSPS